MKRVNIRYGLKQRMNDILGTDFGTEGDVVGLTPWSIQAAMVANMRRIVSAIAADSISGRPMSGLWMTPNGSKVEITAGYGFTKNGDIVVLEVPVSYTATVSTPGTFHMYLKHEMGTVDGDLYADGKNTDFIGQEGFEDIVYDDKAASKKDTVQGIISELIEQSTLVNDNPDWVYLGTITIAGSVVTVATYSDRRGFGVDPSGWYQVPNIRTTADAHISGDFTVEGQIIANILTVEGAATFEADVTLEEDLIMGSGKEATLPTPANVSFNSEGKNFSGPVSNITVVNGIVTEAS